MCDQSPQHLADVDELNKMGDAIVFFGYFESTAGVG